MLFLIMRVKSLIWYCKIGNGGGFYSTSVIQRRMIPISGTWGDLIENGPNGLIWLNSRSLLCGTVWDDWVGWSYWSGCGIAWGGVWLRDGLQSTFQKHALGPYLLSLSTLPDQIRVLNSCCNTMYAYLLPCSVPWWWWTNPLELQWNPN